MAADQVLHRLVRPPVGNGLGQVLADGSHVLDAQPHRGAPRRFGTRFQHRLGRAPVDVGPAHDHAVAAGVGHDRLRRPEPHRLPVQQRRGECSRIVVLEPRARVHEIGERDRVALGEAEVGEGDQLVEDLVGHVPGDDLRSRFEAGEVARQSGVEVVQYADAPTGRSEALDQV